METITTSASSLHSNNLNFLRLFFASLVLVAHGPELRDGDRSRELLTRAFGTISFGEFAVAGFFILSGYLIVGSWQRRPQVVDFIEKRIRRIVPGFIVAFAVSVFVAAPLGAQDAAAYFHELNYRALFSMAVQLKHPLELPPNFVGTPYPYVNGAMWTIEFEVRCYALALLFGLAGVSRQKGVWLIVYIVALGLMLMSDQVRTLNLPGQKWYLVSPPEFINFVAFFSAGACFKLFGVVSRGRWAVIAAVALLFLLTTQHDLALLGLATVGAYALFWFAFASIPLLTSFQRIDDISYGLYLYGWPIQKLLDWYLPSVSIWLLIPLALLFASLSGYISWNLIEKPFLRSNKGGTVPIKVLV
ncbi:acyltransferase family protein [Hymenobacter sp. HDW8]|uniref:acyltransferase family protein n=1 Tax=Hymenobacter sp. HDW8 TaxID=2714932 RepID=UPI00140BBDC4|nr:acyltransferase [Hymenobacter sp. HDW8]QIL77244.1 acyltransferase [Hymenobacter sp. HDW8]